MKKEKKFIIVNCTPHAINIVENADFDAKQRKFISNDKTIIVKSILPSGILLNAKTDSEKAESIDGIPTIKNSYSEIDRIPVEKGDFFIVSALYVNARREMGFECDICLTVSDTVYDKDSLKPIGCLNLRRN